MNKGKDIRESGYQGIRISGNQDIRISGYQDIRGILIAMNC